LERALELLNEAQSLDEWEELLEINAKTDLKIKVVSIERSKHRRVVALDFAIKTQTISKGATRLQ